ncbi:UvrD-helicase domain-containing protein [Nosocomiicoccus sp. HMSC09A07]|uniref:UvrD-helicase domain-containing protein n=1 Tax=Nosocomiicoccus sp. HMSC09A07 TaxID=1581145 RepID=UPI0008A3AB99|nr:UvrD-helicase domain-containing protein [Nosocomiicoccus sp. HMSC09A07]OFS62291.1 hypothetical protein HMPREF3177_05985 [Nosocomiicoccus sp. HMSC09A07]
METKLNDAQYIAVHVNAKNVLVSAAAGSGKTFVLVERILNNIRDKNYNIDEMLISTFTNDSAKDMKSRIENKLREKGLDEQVLKLNNAQISTMHSFCLSVIQDYGYLLGLSNNIRTIDENEQRQLFFNIAEKILDKYVKENNEDFVDLLNGTAEKNNPYKLIDKLETLYNVKRSSSDLDEHFSKKTYENSDIYSNEFEANYNAVLKEILNEIENRLVNDYESILSLNMIKHSEYYQIHEEEIKSIYKNDLDITPFPSAKNVTGQTQVYNLIKNCYKSIRSYKDSKEKFYNVLKAVETKGKYFSVEKRLLELLDSLNFTEIPTFSKLKKDVQKYYDVDKHDEDVYNELRSTFMKSNFKETVKKLILNRLIIEPKLNKHKYLILKLLDDIDEELREYKFNNDLVDYNDYEHFTIQILKEFKDVRNIYTQKFKEILIDEYQDFNKLQEEIVKLLTTDDTEKTVFMVGDVKQSIYQFRLSDPDLFNDKYNSPDYVTIDKKDDLNKADQNVIVNLSRNYRSSKGIIDITNNIFKNVMKEEVGGINYTDEHFLKLYKENASDITIKPHVYRSELNSNEKLDIEKKFIVSKIKSLIKEGGVEFKDIAILTSTRSNHKEFSVELASHGIPTTLNTRTGFFESLEITILLSVLKAVDDPLDDAALVGMMRLPIFNFTLKDLALIKTNGSAGHYIYSLYTISFDKKNIFDDIQLKNKVNVFLDKLKKLTVLAKYSSVTELVEKIIEELELEFYIKTLSLAESRLNNIENLINLIENFEQQGLYTISDVLNQFAFYQRKEIDFGDGNTITNKNKVKIMTVHASKGLEFKHVIYADLYKKFRFDSAEGRFVVDPKNGIGLNYFFKYKNNFYNYETDENKSIKGKYKLRLLGEELRKMYVACTRAEENLEMLIFEENPKSIESSTTPQDVLLNAIETGNVEVKEITNNDLSIDNQEFFNSDEEEKHDIRQTIEFKEYKGVSDGGRGSLLSATKIKEEINKNENNFDDKNNVEFKGLPVPNIYKGTTKLVTSPGLLGTFMHELMEYTIKASKEHNYIVSDDLIEDNFKKVLNKHRWTESQVSRQKAKFKQNVNQFFEEEFIIDKLRNAKNVFFEHRFNVKLTETVGENYKGYNFNEGDLLEGVIDLLIQVNDDEYIIVDYKTDTVSSKDTDGTLISKYEVQLELYKQALIKSNNAKKVDAYLYFFNNKHSNALLKV